MMLLPRRSVLLLGLLAAALLVPQAAGQDDVQRPGALRGGSYSSSFSTSESWSSGSDGKMHSQVRAVSQKTVGDGTSSHTTRTALACADGRCREATAGGPNSDSGAADGAQSDVASVGYLARDPAEGRPRSAFGAFGRPFGFEEEALRAPRPHFVFGGFRMPAIFGGAEEEEEEPALAEDAKREERDLGMPPLGFGGSGELKGMKDFIRGMEGRMAKGEAGSSSDSSSVSQSYSYSNMNGKEHKEEMITRCKNGKCTTVKRSNEPHAADKEAKENDEPGQAEGQQILVSTGSGRSAEA